MPVQQSVFHEVSVSMRPSYLFTAFVCLVAGIAQSACSQPRFQKKFQIGSGSSTTCTIKTLDGGYLVGGYRLIGDVPQKAIATLTKFDMQGNVTWCRTLPDSPQYTITAITQLVNGRYAATGSVMSTYFNSVFVCVVDTSGSMVWARDLDPSGNSNGIGIAPTYSDGMIVSCPSGISPNDYGTHPYMAYLDEDGKLGWCRIIRDSLPFTFVTRMFGHVAANIDDGVVGVGGGDPQAVVYPAPFFIWQMSESAQTGWRSMLRHDSIAVVPQQIIYTQAGWWVVAGYAVLASQRTVPFVASFGSGLLNWFKLIDLPGAARTVIEASDRTFVVGVERSDAPRASLVRLDANGGYLSARALGFPNEYNSIRDALLRTDRTVILSGNTSRDSLGREVKPYSEYLMAESDSLSGCNLSGDSVGLIDIPKADFRPAVTWIDTLPTSVRSIAGLQFDTVVPSVTSFCTDDVPQAPATIATATADVFPNPASRNGYLTLQLHGNFEGAYLFSFYDPIGAKRLSVRRLVHGDGVQEINASALDAGTYLIEVRSERTGEIVATARVVIEK